MVSSAVMKMLALYFGTDEVMFSVTGANPNANPNLRIYASFTDAALDVVEGILRGYIPAPLISTDVRSEKVSPGGSSSTHSGP